MYDEDVRATILPFQQNNLEHDVYRVTVTVLF